MPVPNSMQDLSNVAGDNYPVGSEPIGNNLDNYLRAHASLIRHPYSLASQSMASGSTVSVANANGESVLITGDSTINSLGAGYVGCKRELRFNGSPTLAHSSALQLPGNADISAAPGLVLKFRCIANNTWVYTGGTYTPPLDAAVIASGIFPVERGGLGVDELEEGHFLVGNGTGPVQTRSPTELRSDIEAASLGANTYSGSQTIRASGNSSRMLVFQDAGGVAVGQIRGDGGGGLTFSGGGNFVRLRPNGLDNSAGQLFLSASGDVTASGVITAPNVTATSDRRLKRDIRRNTPRRELLDLTHYLYRWKKSGLPGIGVMAQDVREIAPEYVHESEDGTLSVDKAGLALEMVLALAGAR